VWVVVVLFCFLKASRFVPLLDRVLVQRLKPSNKTVGGIVLPESATQKLNQGKVVAVGPGAFAPDGKVIKPAVQVDDVVVLSEYGGQELKLDGDEFSLYREEDILGIYKD
jgi:chaperonin GroES